MHQALADVATQIRDLLLTDPFTLEVVPDYLREAVLAYPGRGGKMLRPALVLWSCGACRGKPELARHAAAAVEIFHTWTLVHDDIIDCDESRRGKPAVHVLVRDLAARRFASATPDACRKFGTDMAILAGDIQQAWANRLLLRCRQDGVPAGTLLTLLEKLNGELNPGLIGGEAQDVEFELRPFAGISSGEMLEMLRRKTALLLRFCAEAGALIATGDPAHPHVAQLGDFAEKCGLAFQLRDDVLGMYADPDALGKPVGSDLRQAKRTLLFAVALERLEGAPRERFLRAHGNPELQPLDVARVGDDLRDCGAVDWIEDMALALVNEARTKLEALPDTPWRALLMLWANFMLDRAY